MPSLKVILPVTFLLAALGTAHPRATKNQAPRPREAGASAGKQTFVKHCASCHGTDGKGGGPAAAVLNPQPPDLTTLTRRHNGKYPAGYVGALLKFGRRLTAHGSEDMPVWASRFRELDPVVDPTGQHHIDGVVAYLASLQAE
jgi:mono/diheme cytochrome c family protein